VQLDPIQLTLKVPGTGRLKQKHDEPLSSFAFKFNFHRYTPAAAAAASSVERWNAAAAHEPAWGGAVGVVDSTATTTGNRLSPKSEDDLNLMDVDGGAVDATDLSGAGFTDPGARADATDSPTPRPSGRAVNPKP